MAKKKSILNIWYWYFILLLQFSYGANEFESRNTVSYTVKLSQPFKFEFEQSLRLSGQQFSFKQTFTEMNLSYELIDGFRVFIPFRYAIYEDEIKKRLSFGGLYKYNFSSISLRYKTRFQRVYENGEKPDDVFRNKFSINYKISKKLEPFLSGELFHPINIDNNDLDEYRLSCGADIDLPKKKSIKLYYTFKLEDINKQSPDITNIVGLSYSLN